MKLIKQPNRWSCMLASLSMLIEIPISELIEQIGHDGSKILWPSLDDPISRKGFSEDEIVEAAYSWGFGLIPFSGFPTIWTGNPSDEPVPVYDEEENELRLKRLMTKQPGLIVGQHSLQKFHAVAWDGFNIYDPYDPRIYSFETPGVDSIAIIRFYALYDITRIKSN